MYFEKSQNHKKISAGTKNTNPLNMSSKFSRSESLIKQYNDFLNTVWYPDNHYDGQDPLDSNYHWYREDYINFFTADVDTNKFIDILYKTAMDPVIWEYRHELLKLFYDRISSRMHELIHVNDLYKIGEAFFELGIFDSEIDLSELFAAMENDSRNPEYPEIYRDKIRKFLRSIDPYIIRSTCRDAYETGKNEGEWTGLIRAYVDSYDESDISVSYDRGFEKGFYEGQKEGFHEGRKEGREEGIQIAQEASFMDQPDEFDDDDAPSYY